MELLIKSYPILVLSASSLYWVSLPYLDEKENVFWVGFGVDLRPPEISLALGWGIVARSPLNWRNQRCQR